MRRLLIKTGGYTDYQLLLFLFFVSFVSVYFLPVMFNRVIFLLILVAAYRTKLDYVYLTWFFIISDAPGRLFSSGSLEATARIPLYPVISGVSMGFLELFIIIYLIKYLKSKKPKSFIFKKEFIWYMVFGIVIAAFSPLLGMSFTNAIGTYRHLLPWSLVFIVPAFINDKKTLIRTSKLIFPVVILAFVSQLHSYFTGDYLNNILQGSVSGRLEIGEEASRSYSAVTIILFSLIQAFYFMFNRKTEMNRNYLGMIVFLGYLSVIMSAIRGWIIALSAILLGVMIFFGFQKSNKKIVRLVVVSAIAFYFIQLQFPLVTKQIDASFERFATMEDLMHGDITAGGTLQRLDIRGPKVMKKFWESPVVGYGFSDEFYRNSDGHVGNQNILLNVGILGYFLLIGVFVRISIKIWKMSVRKEFRISENRAPVVYLFGLIAVFIIHSSSSQFWGYTISDKSIIFFAFFMAAVNAVYLSRQILTHKPRI